MYLSEGIRFNGASFKVYYQVAPEKGLGIKPSFFKIIFSII
jgi:hypothetical protein